MEGKGVVSRGGRTATSLIVFIFTLALAQLPVSAANVTVQWDPSPDPSVVGYNFYYGVASRTYTNIINVGNATIVTVSNLVAGTTYYFAATAYNILGIESVFSDELVYTIPAATNAPPTLNAIGNLTINEDASAQTVNLAGITSGSGSENQTLTVTATSSNPSLIPNPTVNYTSPNTTGTLTFTPVANANGTATITVTVNDGQAQNNLFSRTFTVTVNAVNDPPTLNNIGNLTINEDAAAQTVNLAGITSGAANENQTLTVTATSSNPGLIPNPTVSYTSPNATGTLTFTPVADANGTATITVTVNDGQAQNNTFSRTFTVTVNAVNDPPTLNALGNLTLNESAGLQTVNLAGITSGAANENQTLTVTATSSNPGLIPNPTVSYTSPNTTGTLTFTPVANASGTATITVTVNDGQAQNNIFSRTFTVTVDQFVNTPPTLNAIGNLTINEDASA
ncbi:MAG: cadherin-like domain-containing protein, partial [Verrucomicrobia bacterium]|nr:cadherin-like domain-containing protein [Verrucomicrobiota bacterium]